MSIKELQPDLDKILIELSETFNNFKKSRHLCQYRNNGHLMIKAILSAVAGFAVVEISGMTKSLAMQDNETGEMMNFEQRLNLMHEEFSRLYHQLTERLLEGENDADI